MHLDLATLFLFAGALILAAGSPGPSIAALVARVISSGWRDVLPFVAAMWIGEMIWLSAAVFGLAALAETLHWAFLVLKYLGIAYLLYLAWQMWCRPTELKKDEPQVAKRGSQARMFLAGFAVTLGNPKIMVFYLALLPNIVDLATLSLLGWLELCATLLIVLAAIDLAYVFLAARARRLLTRPSAVRAANRLSAVFMGGAAAGLAAK